MTIKTLLATFTALPLFLNAQKEITVNDTLRTFSKGTFPSYQTVIPHSVTADVEKDWMKYLKEGSKEKPLLVEGEIMMTGAVSKNVTPSTFNVYSKLLETQDGVQLTAWFTGPDSAYISKQTNADQHIALQKYVRDFAVAEYQNAVRKELDGENSKLLSLENQLKDLIKKEDKSNKKISENNRSIDKNKDAIRTNQADQKAKSGQIQTQKTAVANTESAVGSTNKAAKQDLKNLENEKIKLEKESDKLGKEIDNWNEEIRAEKRTIEAGKAEQKTKSDEIAAQKIKGKEVETKLNAIK